MIILCPKCGKPGSLEAYSKGRGRSHQYYRIKHKAGKIKRCRHYIHFKEALALLAVGVPFSKDRRPPKLAARIQPTGMVKIP